MITSSSSIETLIIIRSEFITDDIISYIITFDIQYLFVSFIVATFYVVKLGLIVTGKFTVS